MDGMDTGAPRLVAGAMTGTSMDGIDVALARIEGAGLAMSVEIVRRHAQPLDALADGLREATRRPDAGHGALAVALGALHADAFATLLDGVRPDFVAAHGQTIAHRPPVSRQLLDPHPIAERLGCPVVHDLRQADLAAGGQGAPITPIADWVLFRADAPRLVVNLGGFCNVTRLGAGGVEEIEAFDVCACNHVLDAVARGVLGCAYDEDGRCAARGMADAERAADLRERLEDQARAGRSLGNGDELTEWVDEHAGAVAPDDLAATAVEAVAAVVAGAARDVEEVVVAGGGALNRALVSELARRCDGAVRSTEELGVPVEAREALAMAVLGALSRDGVAITLPQVTGCARPAPVAGRWVEPETPLPRERERTASRQRGR
jgi:1,6-anhydro-N-acetylmuramate kinase